MAARSLPAPVRRARHRLRSRVSEYPALYLPFARHKYPGPSPEVISSQTELVIDGYTRSASTFAVYAFQLCQDRPVRLAHHLHAPAQLIAAARGGIPALLLIREPQGAILSQLVQEPGVVLRDALDAYIRFHACLRRYADCFTVAEFEQVTRDFGSVIQRLNARFGTSFTEFRHTDAGLRECFELMGQRGTLSPALLGFESGTVTREQLYTQLHPLSSQPPVGEVREAWVPSERRYRTKAALRDEWNQPGLGQLRDQAQAGFEEFLAMAGAPARAGH